jgi:hypothetical protein
MRELSRVQLGRRPLRAIRRHGAVPMQPALEAEWLEPRQMLSASVVSYHNDHASDGQNLQEAVLTPSNVNSSTFGKVFKTNVDGNVYAQPLFVPKLSIDGVLHNVLFVATEHDSVYALDANTGSVLWHKSLLTHGLPGATSIRPIPSADAFLTQGQDITPEIGITSTPVIDLSTRILYVVASTKETVNGVAHYVQRLHALGAFTGAEKLGGPVLIGDTTFVDGVYTNNTSIFVNGSGDGNDGHGHVFFNAARANQRSALTLANGRIYIAWASYGDNSPYHGWIAAFNSTTLALRGVLNTTPNGGLGGIWAAGGGVSVDAQGNLYVMTGNGTFDGDNSGGTKITGLNDDGFPEDGDFGDSFIKIKADSVHNSPNDQNINGWGLKVVDYFTPYNQATLNAHDRDLGSGAPLLLPDSAGNTQHPHLLVGSGKQGVLYLLDRDNMGKFSLNKTAEVAQIPEEITSQLPGGLFGTPAYFNKRLYIVSTGGTNARTFSVPNGKAHIPVTPTSLSPDTFSWPGSTPSISANRTTNGIVWNIDRGTDQLRAYSASGYNTKLYTSAQAPNNRDALGSVVKFTLPTVVNGFVYVGTTDAIVAYGLLDPPAPALAQVNPAPKSASTVTGPPIGAINQSALGASSLTNDRSTPRVSGLQIDLNLAGGTQTGPPIAPADSSAPPHAVSSIDWPWIGQGNESDPAKRFDWLFPV